MRWQIPSVNPEAVARLSRELKVSALVGRLLVLRDVREPEAAERFLNPSLAHLHDPFLMADMRAAVERLRCAIARKEKILIYGDYDVDGTMAVVVLLTALRGLGASVDAYIPHRLTDGYGMRVPVVEKAHSDGYSVVLSVDTGIREHEVLTRARGLGLDCIVTDHHLPGDRLPPACAILNPRRGDCRYPEKNLSGVGVAFKLAQTLVGERWTDRHLQSYLKIVALGTIADVVPLVGENRVIAHFGLAGLSGCSQRGLEALLEVAGLRGRAVGTGDVAFRLAPRVNAAGRMENARDVIDLFTTSDPVQARAIAERLDALNRERQRVEDEILSAIIGQQELRPEKAAQYSLVFAGEGWHRGVIGIVAQRAVERYYRPTLVIGVENGEGVGSGRAIKGFHLLEALNQTSDLFERFGGHAQAAGFTLPAKRIPELEGRFEAYARATLRPEDLEPVLRVDGEVNLGDFTLDLFEQVKRLEPCGFGNPTPIFVARCVRLLAPPRVLKEKHLKLRVEQGGASFDALGWGMAARASELAMGDRVDSAFTLDENDFQGEESLQLILKDFKKRS
ncbi:MAG: single-stranded-DNA-specific exonuclease RecJ [Terriglobia bacterium]